MTSESLYRALAALTEWRGLVPRGYHAAVSGVAMILAERAGLVVGAQEALRTACWLHTIGWLELPAHLAYPYGLWSSEEWQLRCSHVELTEQCLVPLVLPEVVMQAMRHMYERWDGRGYPNQYSAEQIPLLARILWLAQQYIALRSQVSLAETHLRIQRLTAQADPQLLILLMSAFAVLERRFPQLPNWPAIPARAHRLQHVPMRAAIFGTHNQVSWLSPLWREASHWPQPSPQQIEQAWTQGKVQLGEHLQLIRLNDEAVLLWEEEPQGVSLALKRNLAELLFDDRRLLLLDTQMQIVQVGDILAEQLGYTVPELVGLELHCLAPEQPTALVAWRQLQQHIVQAQATQLKLELKTKQGHPLWLSWRIEPLWGAQGALRCVAIVSQELNPIRYIGLEAHRLLEISQEVVMITDEQGHFLYINPAAEDLLGRSSHQVLGELLLEMLHHEDQAASLSILESMANIGEQAFLELENRVLSKHGWMRWVAWRVTTFPAEGRIYWMGRDMTQKEHSRLELRYSQAMLNSVLQHIPLGICVTDAVGRMVQLNAAYARWYGETVEQLQGRHFTVMLAETDRATALELHRRYVAHEIEAWSPLWYLESLGGERKPLHLTITRFQDNQGHTFQVLTALPMSNPAHDALWQQFFSQLPRGALLISHHINPTQAQVLCATPQSPLKVGQTLEHIDMTRDWYLNWGLGRHGVVTLGGMFGHLAPLKDSLGQVIYWLWSM